MIIELTETDPIVVEVVGDAPDAEVATHHLLQVGARAVRAAGTTLDTAVVERAFATMRHEFDRGVGVALARLTDATATATAGLLDDEGGPLAAWRTDVERLLDETFDPDSKRSALARIDELLAAAGERHATQLRRVLDPADPDNPVARLRSEVLDAVREQRIEITTAFSALAERVAVSDKEVEVLERTSAKGFAYEDLVHAHVSRLVAPYGDIAEQVGTTPGAAGTKIGDETVTLNPDDVAGLDACWVLEVKDRKLSVRKTLAELDAAIDNRDAIAGVAVFSRQEHAPVAVPFQHQGNRAIVVFDKDDPDDAALRLACLWARWVVRRDTVEAPAECDVERVAALLEQARQALGSVSTIRGAHSRARRGLDEAQRHLDDLAADVGGALDEIEVALADGVGDDPSRAS